MKKNKQITRVASTGKAAGWIAGKFRWIQTKWARGMDRLINRLTLRKRAIVMTLILILMVGYNIFVVARTFGRNGQNFNRPVDIRMPVNLDRGRAANMPAQLPRVVLRVIRYHKYLDSLSGTDSGEKMRDSLLRGHPGLLDSINQIEKIYCER
ncbi:hypothetical protein [Taibaiella koreensis]|uniref:hypothetical protein n=1 Tax=Taibaiella koreensis TaxID=1268548 RepID=UPI000E59DB67|nr:hypothetical protein [Taibaiella koreensis]